MAHVLFATDGLSGACYEVGLNCTAIPAGCADIADEAWADFRRFPGTRRWDGTAVVIDTPAPVLAAPRTITGNQWAFALGDLGLAAAWRAGTARSKDKDQIRVGLIARDTPLTVTDPLLIRVAANAGTDTNGVALIDVPTVFQKALTEST